FMIWSTDSTALSQVSPRYSAASPILCPYCWMNSGVFSCAMVLSLPRVGVTRVTWWSCAPGVGVEPTPGCGSGVLILVVALSPGESRHADAAVLVVRLALGAGLHDRLGQWLTPVPRVVGPLPRSAPAGRPQLHDR